MEGDTTDDLHGIVLNSAFKAMISNPSKVLVNTRDNTEMSLNRNVLILFSPVIRNILSSVPCCTTPTLYLPDISTATIIKLRDILNKGISGDFWDLKESGEVLEAASALGIDMPRLHYGADRVASSSGDIMVNVENIGNKSKQMKKAFDQKKTEGKEIVFVRKNIKSPSRDPAPAPVVERPETSAVNINTQENLNTNRQAPVAVLPPEIVQKRAPTQSSSTPSIPSLVPNVPSSIATNVQIKKEAHAIEEDATNIEESIEHQLGSSGLKNSANLEQFGSAVTIPSITPDTEDLKNQCEKCKKAFASLTLLRYHYCSHFRGILKKKFSNLFHDNKCLECFKTFANPGRLLLHIGVQHDKINEILKSKGITELPPFSATAAALGVVEASGYGSSNDHATVGNNEREEHSESIVATTSTPLGDVKNIPLIKSVTELNTSHTPQNTTTPTTNSKVSTETSNVSLNETTSSMMSNASSVISSANTSLDGDKNDSTTECNYDLECQVCDQKLKTISLLEQHCCRHFMKELQDQYSSLMDGLKCNVCYNSFKQKHSLLLHIGCKHGKINEILKKKNFSALPCPVNNTSSAAMQKQLIQIKKEKQDMKEETYNMSTEMMDEEPAGSLLNETPPAPDENSPAFSTTLDEILKKYRFPAGSSGSTK